jgi:glutamate 5-kinase
VFGEFERGAVVACVGEDGNDIARGLTNYNAEDARRIAGHASKEIETLLGYGGDAEIIHRDNLVLM